MTRDRVSRLAIPGRSAVVAAGLGLVAVLGLAGPSSADASLTGSWSGGGTVTLPSGAVEKARCRATFHRHGGNDYSMSAVCATASTRIAQSAQLHQVGPMRFSGNFHNPDYNVGGTIRINLSGNSLSASLDGGGGSGHFHLSR